MEPKTRMVPTEVFEGPPTPTSSAHDHVHSTMQLIWSQSTVSGVARLRQQQVEGNVVSTANNTQAFARC